MARQLDAVRALGGGVAGQALADDLDAFDDFEHADHEPVPGVADDGLDGRRPGAVPNVPVVERRDGGAEVGD